MNKLDLAVSNVGYTVDVNSGVSAISFESPKANQRLETFNNASIVNLTWQTGVAGYEYLKQAYRYSELKGNPPFLIDLLLNGGDIAEFKAKFVLGTFRLAEKIGRKYIVNASIYAITENEPSEPEYPLLCPPPPVVYDCYFADFDLDTAVGAGGPGGPVPGGFTTSMGDYGIQLNCPSVTNLNYYSIKWAIPAPVPFVRVACTVKVTSTDPEDTCKLVLHDGNGYPVGTSLWINPRRESAFDPTRRCSIGYRLAGSTTDVDYYTEALTIGDWYRIEAYIEGSSLMASIQNLTDETAPNVYTVGSLPPFVQYSTYDELHFAQDGPAPGAPSPTIIYAQVEVCDLG
jgi:hypothetical protein